MPEVGPPKVAVETPSDEEFAMASRGVFNPPIALHSIDVRRAIRLITCVKPLSLVFQVVRCANRAVPPKATK